MLQLLFLYVTRGCCMKYDVNVLVGIFHHQIGYESNLYTQIDVKRPTASPLQIKQEEDLNPDLR